jgi:hypothetical protein
LISPAKIDLVIALGAVIAFLILWMLLRSRLVMAVAGLAVIAAIVEAHL